MSTQDPIPFHTPSIEASELAAVTNVLKSGWLTTGPVTARFEKEFRDYVGAHHALAVSSATAGLHLSLAALGIGPGDEVITTPLTFCATVNAILYVGATPVLADIDETFNISPSHVKKLITPRTKAILPVHFAGLPCNMTSLWRLARQHGLAVVEDAAHAVGASRTGQRVGGGQSDAVVFSFYATKNMTTGEGGMVTTPSEELHDRLRVLSLHGMSKQAWNRYSAKGSWAYDVVSCGFKYNMTDIAAAIGSEQLSRLDAMTRRRREIVAAYASAFAGMPELETPPAGDPGHCWHLFVLRLNLEMLSIDRAEFFDEMKARGISCSVHFIPIPLHSHYRNSIEMRDPCNRALSEYPRMISLPLYPRMSDEQVNRVIETVRDIATSHSRRSRTYMVAGAEAND